MCFFSSIHGLAYAVSHKTIMEAGKTGQAELQANHIKMVVIAVFSYRLYRENACMQES